MWTGCPVYALWTTVNEEKRCQLINFGISGLKLHIRTAFDFPLHLQVTCNLVIIILVQGCKLPHKPFSENPCRGINKFKDK